MANDRPISVPRATPTGTSSAGGSSKPAREARARSVDAADPNADEDDPQHFDPDRLVEIVDEGSSEQDLLAEPTKKPRTLAEYADIFDEAMRLCRDHLNEEHPVELEAGKEYFVVSTKWVHSLIDNLALFEKQHAAQCAQAATQKQQAAAAGKGRRASAASGGWSPDGADFWTPVDNASLVERYTRWGAELKPGLVEIDSYLLVPGTVWKRLMDLFGGGPEIVREAFEERGRVFVDVRGYTLRVLCSNNLRLFRSINMPKFATVKALRAEACRRWDIEDPEKVRLWDFDDEDKLAGCWHEKLDDTLLELNVRSDQLVLVEMQDPDGSWPLDSDEVGDNAGSDGRSSSVGRRASFDMGRSRPTRVVLPGRIGIYNLRNSCYMSSTLQCLSNVPPLRSFFVTDDFLADLNEDNPLGTKGELARAFSALMRDLWEPGERPPRAVYPDKFKRVLDDVHPDFEGFMQHDSQELLSYLLDDLHEDVNRVRKKEMTAPVESRGRPDAEVAKEARAVYAKRNDSRVADLCTGMLVSKVVCPTEGCRNVSSTFDPFMVLPLPVQAAPERYRVFEVTVVPEAAPLRRRVVRVKALSRGPCVLLRNAVAREANMAAENLLMAELAEHKIVRVLADSWGMDEIALDAPLYAFEYADTLKHVQMLHGVWAHWLRPTLASTGGRIVVDENFLPGNAAGAHAEPDYEPGRARNGRGGGPVSAAPPVLGGEMIRVREDDKEGVVLTVTPTGSGPATSALAALRMESSGGSACPFKRGQVWLGSFNTVGYLNSSKPVRFEVFHVEQLSGGRFKVHSMIDVQHPILGGRGANEQEARLLVGEYAPAHVVASEAEDLRLRKQEAARTAQAEREAKARGSNSDEGSEEKKQPPQTERRSVGRFSPKNVGRSLFGRGGKASAAPAAAGGAERETPSSSSSSSQDNSKRTSGLRSVAAAVRRHSGGSGKRKSAKKQQQEEGAAAVEDGVDADGHLGEATFDAGGWRAMWSTYDDEPSYLKRATEFRCRGHVDAKGVVYHGRVLYGDGTGTNFGGDAQSAMDFFLRLAPPEQQQQVNARSVEEQQRMGAVDRKLALNRTRGIRFVSRIAESRDLDIDHAYFGKDFALDPGVMLVDCDITEKDVFARSLRHFAHAYNDARAAADRGELKLSARIATRIAALPLSLSPAEVAAQVSVLHAGKNYALYSHVERHLGTRLDPESEEPFFMTKHAFLRVLLEWERESPVVELFAALDDQLQEEGRGTLLKERANLKISDCVELLCKEETLGEGNSWFCERCKTHGAATKTLRLWSLPRVLILHFKRFSQEPTGEFSDKLNDEIDFPLEGLDLRRFALDPESQRGAVYDLCAVSSHYGGMGSGHYTAYARNEQDGRWYEFDDDVVLPVRVLAQIAGRAAYVLFYLRRDLRPEEWGEPGSSPAEPEEEDPPATPYYVRGRAGQPPPPPLPPP